MTLRGENVVRHGYCLAHLDALAKIASTRAHGNTNVDPGERVDLAWCGIVEHLYTVTERPTPTRLVLAGMWAVSDWAASNLHAHGWRRPPAGGYEASPYFAAYWWARHTSSPEDAIVERRALLQILPTLTPLKREALIALAVHDDYTLAAAAVGCTTRTFYARVERARREFLRAWHEGETPSRLRVDRRAPTHGVSRR